MIANEPAIRLTAFCGVFATMALWEIAAPKRTVAHGRLRRWPANLGILAVDALMVRLLVPLIPVGVALFADRHGIGLLHAISVPSWMAIVASVLLLDLLIYFQHRAFHAVPALWRVHRMHHADLEFDVTTGGRFHPVEIFLSLLIKATAILILGAPAVGVLIFEVLLNASSMFNHGNVRLPAAADRAVRAVLVTPDMHRVHHSILRHETDSNFGFALSWWDRLFATYRPRPARGHHGMTIGIPEFRDPRELGLDRLLTQPFRAP